MAKAKSAKRASAEGALADLLPAASRPSAPEKPKGRGLADQLVRLSIARDQDLVLPPPLRYEDRTRVVPPAELASGIEQQAEGTVVTTDIQYRPRRQLVCVIGDGADGRGARAQL